MNLVVTHNIQFIIDCKRIHVKSKSNSSSLNLLLFLETNPLIILAIVSCCQASKLEINVNVILLNNVLSVNNTVNNTIY